MSIIKRINMNAENKIRCEQEMADEANMLTTQKEKPCTEIDSTVVYQIEYDIERIIEYTRPTDYFKNHVIFSKVVPSIIEAVGEGSCNLFIELAIYTAFCNEYDINTFWYVMPDYLKRNGQLELEEASLKLLKELRETIKYILKPRRTRPTTSGNEPCISINTKNFTFNLPTIAAFTIYPNDYYYTKLIDEITRGLNGEYSKAAKLVIVEFIDTYKKYLVDEPQPFRNIYDVIFEKNRTFHPIAQVFKLSIEKIYDEKDKPITFSFLIALAKAYGLNIQDSKIKKVLDKKFIAIFRDLWWSCELYHKYEIEKWDNHEFRKHPKTISEMVRTFGKAKFLELENDIELTAPQEFFQTKGRPTTKNFYDFINSNIANNNSRLDYLIKEITTLFNEECNGKKDKGNILGLILEASKRLDLFKEKPSYDKFKAAFITNNTSGSIIEIGRSAYFECKEKDRSRDDKYRSIYCKMKEIKDYLEK